jgi:hypothetical protein
MADLHLIHVTDNQHTQCKMSELDPLEQFDDELAATRRLLRRLEKLAVALKRQQRKHPRRLAPLFRLRKLRHRLLACEQLLHSATPQEPVPPRRTVSDRQSTSAKQPTRNVINLFASPHQGAR